MMLCNDATVKGGTYYPLTVKKHLRAQEIAEENRLPCVYLVDSGGANLPNQDEVFPGPRAFRAHLLQPGAHERQGHPADRRGDGLVHRGRRLCAGDERRDDHRQASRARSSSAGPPLVKAATGEVVSAEDARRRRRTHTRLSGVADHLAE
jgi:3-methylcrotonyl-CoA carboxylase beta subunit